MIKWENDISTEHRPRKATKTRMGKLNYLLDPKFRSIFLESAIYLREKYEKQQWKFFIWVDSYF